ncbi:MAG: hypothetical protein RIQ54_609 [Candidatus Parcubacteria bacterium]|jgi:steroid 5-alpha reductase family enzyme
MDMLLQTYTALSIIMAVYMSAWCAVAFLIRRNDVADVAWGLGFFVVTVAAFVMGSPLVDRGFLVVVLVGVWALRLSSHIYLRNRSKTEDYRYQQWRHDWGKWFYLRTFLQVFMLQGFLVLVVSLPAVLTTIYRGGSWQITDVVGFAIWLFGFFFESVGDRQLANFLKNPANKGKLIQTGLWKYTRHPNYFGEIAQWWGVGVISLAVPYGVVGLIGPLTITWLITKVSGVPLLEEKMARHPDFAEYKRKTNMIVPWIPKSS